MKIKEVSEYVGLPISTLHYYERIGLVKPKRTNKNYREYSEKDVEILILIMLMKKHNFNRNEISEVINRYTNPIFDEEQLKKSKQFFENKIIQIEELIHSYQSIIKIIQSLPIMKTQEEYNNSVAKEETLKLIKNLHQTILSEEKREY